jgi:putative ATPase
VTFIDGAIVPPAGVVELPATPERLFDLWNGGCCVIQKGMFDAQSDDGQTVGEPLAARMRPRTLDEFVGQEHLVGPGRVLRRAIEADRISSFILWGPPGTGKTTLARIIAGATHAHFVGLSAVSAGVADLRKVIEEAARHRVQRNQRTILLIDEIHRFNKSQQDSVLHAVEEGVITLVGATTENPSFEVNSALLSRSRVFALRPLRPEDVETVVRRAVVDPSRGLGSLHLEIAPDALAALVAFADGDARVALTGLELAAASVATSSEGERVIQSRDVEEALQRRALRYDQSGDQHYDIVSAFIKSMRGSDPDGALYWLARMLEAGEDPLFIVRRMVILAAEDVGMADPQALVVAVAAQQAVHFIGLPEGYLPMAESAIYLATAPKSNSAIASYGRAREAVEKHGNLPVPLHLRNAPTGLMKSMGYGRGYDYAHDFGADEPRRYRQRYLPDGVEPGLYQPKDIGFEAQVKDRLRRIAEYRARTGDAKQTDSEPGGTG